MSSRQKAGISDFSRKEAGMPPTEIGPSSTAQELRTDGQVTQALCVCVDDVDAHCERARAAGATIAEPPQTHDYGDDYWADRTYRAVDLEGHQWWFLQRVREPETRAG